MPLQGKETTNNALVNLGHRLHSLIHRQRLDDVGYSSLHNRNSTLLQSHLRYYRLHVCDDRVHPFDAFLQLYARLALDAQHFGTISLDLTQRCNLYGFGLLLDLSLEPLEGHVHFCTSTE